jgi:hypothetical protein
MRVVVAFAVAGSVVTTGAIAAAAGLALASSAITMVAEQPSLEIRSFSAAPEPIALTAPRRQVIANADTERAKAD